jgi:hypothetical protein
VLYVSRNGKVRINYLKREDSLLIAKGEVASSSKPNLFHKVEIVYSFEKKYLIRGSCDCEISSFYGICKHQLMLLYVSLRARKKISKTL